MPQQTIIAITGDLMFHSRLEQHVRALGYDFVTPSDAEALREAVDAAPALAILDLHAISVGWREAASIAKQRGIPVLAYGRHTEAGLLRDARVAGCDRVVPRSQLVGELPTLLSEIFSLEIPEK
jgi:hypothetical protein